MFEGSEYMKARLIINPVAGKGQPVVLDGVLSYLASQGWEVDSRYTGCRGEGTALARQAIEDQCDVVIACGGDGTLNDVINGIVGSDAILGVIPLGTVNIWAREAGIPRKPLAAAEALVKGEVRRVDLGLAGDHCFLLMAGVGFDAEVARQLNPKDKQSLGVAAYLIKGVTTALSFTGTRVSVILDGRKLRRKMLLMIVGNTRNYGGIVEITTEAQIDDGFLDVCIFEGQGFFRKLTHLIRVFGRHHRDDPEVEYFRVKSVSIRSSTPLPVQVDGDTIGTTPMTFRILPKALRVILTRSASKVLFQDSPVTS